MTVRPPVIIRSGAAVAWEAIAAAFGIDHYGHPLNRPPKGSWLALLKKELPKDKAIVTTQAWLIRLLWLRRMELWLIDVHDDDHSYAFLDEDHVNSIDELSALLRFASFPLEQRPDDFSRRFPLLPSIPGLQWFSDATCVDLPVSQTLTAINSLPIEALSAFGRQEESPHRPLAILGVQALQDLNHQQGQTIQFETEDGSLLAAKILKKIHLPSIPYRVKAGPGGYRRELPADHAAWEIGLRLIHSAAKKIFAVAPNQAAADRVLFHLAIACCETLHFAQDSQSIASVPAFHENIVVGDALSCKLDIRTPLNSLLTGQAARLGMWRTALKRFHQATDNTSRNEARATLTDLPRHFSVPLRPDGPAYRKLQKLLKLEQQTSSLLFGGSSEDKGLSEAIAEAKLALRQSNQRAFEWRYAFPDILRQEDGAFSGFDKLWLHLPESALFEDPLPLLRRFQVAFQILKPSGIMAAWLPDDFMRHKRYQPLRQWLQQTGEILQTEHCGSEHFDALITGKLLVLWKKNAL